MCDCESVCDQFSLCSYTLEVRRHASTCGGNNEFSIRGKLFLPQVAYKHLLSVSFQDPGGSQTHQMSPDIWYFLQLIQLCAAPTGDTKACIDTLCNPHQTGLSGSGREVVCAQSNNRRFRQLCSSWAFVSFGSIVEVTEAVKQLCNASQLDSQRTDYQPDIREPRKMSHSIFLLHLIWYWFVHFSYCPRVIGETWTLLRDGNWDSVHL